MRLLRKLTKLLASPAIDHSEIEELASLVRQIVPRLLIDERYSEYFRIWESSGFHITPNHFYQPIPDTRALPEELWTHPSNLEGVNMNLDKQVDFLLKIFPKFKDEYSAFPTKPTCCPYEFHLNNNCFDGLDAYVLYCMIRYYNPSLVIEIGSGYSTRVSAQAALVNGSTKLLAIEPYPSDILVAGFPGLTKLYQNKIEEVNLDLFSQLQKNDVLFIDTSHVVKTGGDVNKIFLEIIPRLNPGVIIHVHDIFFPGEYPREWIFGEQRFWTEQYLLQAFLQFNSEFEVLFSNSFLPYSHQQDIKQVFPDTPCGGSSFWMQRKVH